MSEFTSTAGEPRPPTWSERERLEQLREAGIDDVYVDPADAPRQFWLAIQIAAERNADRDEWGNWAREIRFAEGWGPFSSTISPQAAFGYIVGEGYRPLAGGSVTSVAVGQRLGAIDHFMDALLDAQGFIETLNAAARKWRVGVRVERSRLIPVTSEHLHREIIQPTLALLSRSDLANVDALYRKAFDRALSNDPSGAVTAATSAVEEMLRLGLGVTGMTLEPLLQRARQAEWVSAAVQQVLLKLATLRPESDAHAAGTSEFDVAMLALHLTGAALLHLGKTGPFAER